MSSEPETNSGGPVYCPCDEFRIGDAAITNAIMIQSIHGCGDYTGPRFRYCPWCGSLLVKGTHA